VGASEYRSGEGRVAGSLDGDTALFLMRTRMQEIGRLTGDMLTKVTAACEEHKLTFDDKTKLEIALEFTIICYKLRETVSANRQRLCQHLLKHPLPSIMLLDIGLRVVREELPFHRMTEAISGLITDYDGCTADVAGELDAMVMLMAVDSICQSDRKGGALYRYIIRSLTVIAKKPRTNIRCSITGILGHV
jgi:hypothetical protein